MSINRESRRPKKRRLPALAWAAISAALIASAAGAVMVAGSWDKHELASAASSPKAASARGQALPRATKGSVPETAEAVVQSWEELKGPDSSDPNGLGEGASYFDDGRVPFEKACSQNKLWPRLAQMKAILATPIRVSRSSLGTFSFLRVKDRSDWSSLDFAISASGDECAAFLRNGDGTKLTVEADYPEGAAAVMALAALPEVGISATVQPSAADREKAILKIEEWRVAKPSTAETSQPDGWYVADGDFHGCHAGTPGEKIRKLRELGQTPTTREQHDQSGNLQSVKVAWSSNSGLSETYNTFYKRMSDCQAGVATHNSVPNEYN